MARSSSWTIEAKLWFALPAGLNNLQMFASTYRSRIQSVATRLGVSEVDPEVIQAAGEELGDMLGRILEARMNAGNIRSRLESL